MERADVSPALLHRRVTPPNSRLQLRKSSLAPGTSLRSGNLFSTGRTSLIIERHAIRAILLTSDRRATVIPENLRTQTSSDHCDQQRKPWVARGRQCAIVVTPTNSESLTKYLLEVTSGGTAVYCTSMSHAVETKETVRALLDRLPDDCSLDDVLYHLYVIQTIEQGQSDSRAGRTMTHEQVAETLRRKWLVNFEK